MAPPSSSRRATSRSISPAMRLRPRSASGASSSGTRRRSASSRALARARTTSSLSALRVASSSPSRTAAGASTSGRPRAASAYRRSAKPSQAACVIVEADQGGENISTSKSLRRSLLTDCEGTTIGRCGSSRREGAVTRTKRLFVELPRDPRPTKGKGRPRRGASLGGSRWAR